jgi:putative ABC transport system permease protein
VLEALGLSALFGTSARMVTRELGRHPGRTAASVLGVAFAIAVMVVARFSEDGVVALVEAQFEVGRREDLEVSFRRAVPVSVASELRRLPGVLDVELHRVVPVRLRGGHKSRDAVLSASSHDATLSRIVEWPVHTVTLPEDGVLVSRFLAEVLDLHAGGLVAMELLEGDRHRRVVPVAGVVDDVFGLSAYATEGTAARILGAEPTATSALLTVDPLLEDELTARLERLPTLAGITRRRALIDRFNQQVADMMTATTAVLTGFAAAIAVGIIYNNARIALSMRARDLASLRVLGFTRREISAVLLGELAAYVVLAVAPGLALGRGLCVLMMSTVDRELYRFPTIVSPRTYAFAVVVTAATALVSALLVRRKLDRLDLVAVLKTRE